MTGNLEIDCISNSVQCEEMFLFGWMETLLWKTSFIANFSSSFIENDLVITKEKQNS